MQAHRGLRIARFVVAAALLVAAGWIVARSGETLQQAWQSARNASPMLVLALVALPILNWLIVALGFWILNGRFARTRLRVTIALVGGAWLLNYLPMRPGMVGRLAYHKKYDGITLKQSAVVLLESMIATALAGAMMALLAIAVTRHELALGAALLALLAPVLIALLVAAALRSAPSASLWRYAAVFAVRYIDLGVWVARYMAVFAIVGRPLGIDEAVAIALVSHVALLMPLAGNGLGLREWTVALTAGLLPATGGSTEIGAAADLVNRAFEVVVAVPVGLLCMGWLARAHGWHKLGLKPAADGE